MNRLFIFLIRCLVFIIGYFFFAMETASDWIISARSKTEYVRTGKCNRCGRCCRLLALEMPRVISRRDLFARFLSWWHKILFNFDFKGRDGKWLVYRCGYFVDGESPFCRIYPFRHRVCRFYPRQQLYGHPKPHAKCGYKFVRRDGHPSFDEVLRSKRMTVDH